MGLAVPNDNPRGLRFLVPVTFAFTLFITEHMVEQPLPMIVNEREFVRIIRNLAFNKMIWICVLK